MVSEANLEDILKYAKVSPIMNSITLVSGGIGIPSVIEAIKVAIFEDPTSIAQIILSLAIRLTTQKLEVKTQKYR